MSVPTTNGTSPLPEMSPENQAKYNRATRVILTDRIQLATIRDGIAWMVFQEVLDVYLIGLRSGELRWLPKDAVEKDPPEQVPQQQQNSQAPIFAPDFPQPSPESSPEPEPTLTPSAPSQGETPSDQVQPQPDPGA
jgi:hypothetical protein